MLLIAAGLSLAADTCGRTSAPARSDAERPTVSAPSQPGSRPESEPGPSEEPSAAGATCSIEARVRVEPIVVESRERDEAARDRDMLTQLCAKAGKPGCSASDFEKGKTSTAMTMGEGKTTRVYSVEYERFEVIERSAEAPDHAEACRDAWAQLCDAAGYEPHGKCGKRAELVELDGVSAQSLAAARATSEVTCEVQVGRARAQESSSASWADACSRAMTQACTSERCGPSSLILLDGIPRWIFPGRYGPLQ